MPRKYTTIMNTNQSKRLKETICQLSQYESFKELRHERAYSDTLPSTIKLEEIIRICRGILFPGYFGNASVNKQNLAYHMGLNTEKLLAPLSEQIAAGLSFSPGTNTRMPLNLKKRPILLPKNSFLIYPSCANFSIPTLWLPTTGILQPKASMKSFIAIRASGQSAVTGSPIFC